MNIVSDFGDGHDRAIFYKCYTTITFFLVEAKNDLNKNTHICFTTIAHGQ